MNVVLVVLHVIVCVFLIAVVLLQRGKGAEMGAVFGGGASSTVFGGRGAGTFLSKLTTGSAIIFMCTSLTLSYFATKHSGERLFENGVDAEAAAGAPAEQPGPFEDLGRVAPEAATTTPIPDAAAAPEAAAADTGAAGDTGSAPAGQAEPTAPTEPAPTAPAGNASP